MVKLEFRVDEKEISESRADLHAVNAAIVQETHFVLPVRFAIVGVELLAVSADDPWLPLPILDLALVGRDRLITACGGTSALYTLPGVGAHLQFNPAQDRIEITSTLNRARAIASCNELKSAFKSFARNVSLMVLEEAPEIMQIDEWRIWIEQQIV